MYNKHPRHKFSFMNWVFIFLLYESNFNLPLSFGRRKKHIRSYFETSSYDNYYSLSLTFWWREFRKYFFTESQESKIKKVFWKQQTVFPSYPRFEMIFSLFRSVLFSFWAIYYGQRGKKYFLFVRKVVENY